MRAKRPRGVGQRRWVTLTEIAEEFRVRPSRIKELGLLDGCGHLPAGTIGRHALWLWSDVERAAREHATGTAKTPSSTPKTQRTRARRSAPADAFASVAAP